jgi:hypothetical protein
VFHNRVEKISSSYGGRCSWSLFLSVCFECDARESGRVIRQGPGHGLRQAKARSSRRRSACCRVGHYRRQEKKSLLKVKSKRRG